MYVFYGNKTSTQFLSFSSSVTSQDTLKTHILSIVGQLVVSDLTFPFQPSGCTIVTQSSESANRAISSQLKSVLLLPLWRTAVSLYNCHENVYYYYYSMQVSVGPLTTVSTAECPRQGSRPCNRRWGSGPADPQH